uniref:ATP-binding cassette transporter n=1 Tax=Dunaliella tertiolecta TaxID=3047 RepID=A0A6S8M2Q5_DUNTE|mmetsp:Transcript_2945/g.6815  ORF Transcript_2945/g.6815 Transcript_2945/m.6815 type:complete len:863 (+) Transcript_2945:452-3040(+)
MSWPKLGIFLASLVIEIAVVSWSAFHPLIKLGAHVTDVRGITIAYSNMDVWFLSVVKSCILCVLLAPGRMETLPAGTPDSKKGWQLRLMAVSWVPSIYELFLIAKAAGVAVLAPESLYPAWTEGEDAGHPFVGLLAMYTSICAGLCMSVIESWCAQSLVAALPSHTSEEREGQQAEGLADGEECIAGARKGYNKKGGGADAALRAPLLEAAEEGRGGAEARQQVGANGEGRGNGKGKAKDKEDGAKKGVQSKTVWHLLQLSMPDWPIITVAFMFGIAAALMQAVIPYYTGLVIDYASIEPDRQKFKATIVKLVYVAAACGVLSGSRGGLFTVAMSKLNVRIRQTLFAALVNMEVAFFDVSKTGEITSRLSSDTSTVSDQVCLNLNVLLRAATQAAMVLGFMFSASWRLTVITFILVPCVMFISKVYGRYFASLAKNVQSELAAANSVADEVLSSMTTVKAHAAQDSAMAAYANKLERFFALLIKEAIVYALYMCINTFLPAFVAAIVLLYGGTLVLAHTMSPGALVSFMLYQQSLSSAFQMMGDVFSALTAAVGAADKVLELIHRKPDIPPEGELVPANFEGRIDLKDVHFSYPARPDSLVLKGLSMSVAPGEVVALVGSSGGGKSSIVKLLERYYVPQMGEVLIDGRDIGVYNPKWLKRKVALVSQEPVLYARSIRRNIIYGLEPEDGVEPPSQAEIESAARQANAHDFISSFPDGYDTDCGEKGVSLSGGQKQRIAIARALVRNPQVLLLDEATSALDADSEAVVQEALDSVMGGDGVPRTVILIAHRLSTVQNADRVVVVGNGRVQESGSHQELLDGGGVYASLVRRQITHKTPSVSSLAAGSAGASISAHPSRASLRG